MTSIGKFVTALCSSTQEASFALASLNFDFSLIKVDASAEFQGLGAALTSRRRGTAEDGPAHITARKLSALFDQLIPPVPNLIKSYGIRASEIASAPGVNPKGTKDDGFLADHVGADGTTIWAAATSGKSAVAIHLLACLLARIWSGPQAVAIWVELVAERKKELRAGESEEDSTVVTPNIQIDLTREQLSAWDASARAWLQSADRDKGLQHLQTKLIIDNINIPVNTREKVYSGVIRAWKAAMTMTEDLLTGQPQRVQDGAILLGLSAWHLYPDILVLGNNTVHVKQKDTLFPKEAILTVGLASRDSDDNNGVFWSLPLAHLRYYGDPVDVSRSVGADASRISFDDLLQVIFGGALSNWTNYISDMHQAAKVVVSLRQALAVSSMSEIPRWLDILFHAATDYLNTKDIVRESYNRLIAFGKRRGSTFLAPDHERPQPFFGLSEYSTLFGMMSSENERIAALRIIAADLPFENDKLIIRYRVLFDNPNSTGSQSYWEYATARPESRTSTKRSSSGRQHQTQTHVRWILDINTIVVGKRFTDDKEGCGGTCREVCGATCNCRINKKECSVKCHKRSFSRLGIEYNCTNIPRRTKAVELEISLAERASVVDAMGDHCCEYGFDDIYENIGASRDTLTPDFWWTRYTDQSGISVTPHKAHYKALCGDPSTAAIFCQQEPSERDSTSKCNSAMKPSDIAAILDSKLIHESFLSKHLKHLWDFGKDQQPYFQALHAASAAADLYGQLKGSTIDLSVTSKSLAKTTWFPGSTQYAKQRFLSRTQAFACIAFFESGGLELSPDRLENVMALSSGSSLYVAEALLRDPWITANQGEIRRLTGNIGRAGLSLLVPPPQPRVRKFDPQSWQLINHRTFDGEMVDCFKNTSLHLSFTEYELPVDTGTHGGRDHSAYYLESLISVYDGKDWIADLDILAMFRNDKLHRLPRCPFRDYDNEFMYSLARKHGALAYSNHEEKAKDALESLKASGLATIESWLEFMDPPTDLSILMSTDNWYARLAAVAINVQRGYSTCLLAPGTLVCWPCFLNWRNSRQDGPGDITIG